MDHKTNHNPKIKMKNLIKLLGLIAVVSLTIASCKKNVTLPSSITTSYVGTLGYSSASGNAIANPLSATATISGSKGNYMISFSNAVPSLAGLQFEKKNGSYTTVSKNGSSAGVVVDGNTITIGAYGNGESWSFTGTKP